MCDLYDAWNQERSVTAEMKKVRKDGLGDKLERALRKYLAVDDTEIFTLAKARILFEKMLEPLPPQEQMEYSCAMHVKKVDQKYKITLVLLDKDNNFVPCTTQSSYGYELQAQHIDEMLTRFMDGEELKILPNPNR